MADAEESNAGKVSGSKRPAPDDPSSPVDDDDAAAVAAAPSASGSSRKNKRTTATSPLPQGDGDGNDEDEDQADAVDDDSGAKKEPAGEETREERLRKNREKARDRRHRKKALIEEMQRNVVVLSRMNAELKAKNQELLKQLAQYGAAGQVSGVEGLTGTEVSFLGVLTFACPSYRN